MRLIFSRTIRIAEQVNIRTMANVVTSCDYALELMRHILKLRFQKTVEAVLFSRNPVEKLR